MRLSFNVRRTSAIVRHSRSLYANDSSVTRQFSWKKLRGQGAGAVDYESRRPGRPSPRPLGRHACVTASQTPRPQMGFGRQLHHFCRLHETVTTQVPRRHLPPTASLLPPPLSRDDPSFPSPVRFSPRTAPTGRLPETPTSRIPIANSVLGAHHPLHRLHHPTTRQAPRTVGTLRPDDLKPPKANPDNPQASSRRRPRARPFELMPRRMEPTVANYRSRRRLHPYSASRLSRRARPTIAKKTLEVRLRHSLNPCGARCRRLAVC